MKYFVAAAMFLPIGLGFSEATTSFTSEELLFQQVIPLSVATGDMDGDGDQDVVVSSTGGTVIYENTDGLGTLLAHPLSTVRNFLWIADLDGDGDQDIVTSDIRRERLDWHRNDGDLDSFTAPISLTTGDLDIQFPPIDIDGDGHLDLAWIVRFGSRSVSYLLNTGTAGAFGSVQSIPLANDLMLFGSQLEDYTGDGVADFIVIGGDGEIDFFPGSVASGYSLGSARDLISGEFTPVASGRIDGDADTDLLVRTIFSEYFWYSNDGSGNFTSPQPAGSNSAQEALIVDGNIMYRRSFGESATWLANTDGAGTFAAAPVDIVMPDSMFNDIAAADLDGDGRSDFIGVQSTGALTSLQLSPNTFTAQQPFLFNPGDIKDIAIDDLEGDSTADVILVSEFGSIFQTARAGGTFTALTELSEGHGDPTDLLVADLDGANGSDFVTFDTNDDIVRWSQRAADGTYAAPVTVDTGDAPQEAVAADFNDDGITDFAIAFGGDDRVSVFTYNPTSTNFTKTNLTGVIDGAIAIAAGDIDGDDDMDIISGSLVNGNVYKFTNDGDGNFSAATLVGATPLGINHIALGDADGIDGLDIFVIENSGTRSTFTLLSNDGSGTFTVSTPLSDIPAGLNGFAVVDFDEDGDADFAASNSNRRYVAWFENDGAGTFTRIDLSTGDRRTRLRAGDIDGDGDTDLLSAQIFSTSVGWFENELPETPPSDDPIVVWAFGEGVRGDELLDLLSDGDSDGFTLLEEFAHGLDPLSGESDGALTLDPETGAGSFSRRRDAASIGLAYTAEYSMDLFTWNPISVVAGAAIDADYETVTFTRSPLLERLFVRVEIEYTN